MTTSTTESPVRPRVAGDREAEILEGTLSLLVELGYDRLTFDAIATEVRASKATLYRKWPTKAELVMSAIEYLFEKSHGPEGMQDTGSLVGDLEGFFCSKATMLDQMPGVMAAALPALHRDPDMAVVFKEKFMEPRVQELEDVMIRAQRRGEIGPDADIALLSSVLPAMNFHRVLTTGTCPDAEYVAQVIHQILLPACRADQGLSTDSGQKES